MVKTAIEHFGRIDGVHCNAGVWGKGRVTEFDDVAWDKLMSVNVKSVFLLATAVTGGLFSLSLILARGSAGQLAVAGPPWLGRLLEPKGDIPYGVAIAAGVLIAFPHSPLISAFTGG